MKTLKYIYIVLILGLLFVSACSKEEVGKKSLIKYDIDATCFDGCWWGCDAGCDRSGDYDFCLRKCVDKCRSKCKGANPG